MLVSVQLHHSARFVSPPGTFDRHVTIGSVLRYWWGRVHVPFGIGPQMLIFVNGRHDNRQVVEIAPSWINDNVDYQDG